MRKRAKNRKWTRETLKETAKNFKTAKEWNEKDNTSYQAAARLKLLGDKYITGHLIKLTKPIYKWTKQAVLKDALQYNTKHEWARSSKSAYRAARERGYLQEATAHMTLLGSKYHRCLYSIKIKGEKNIYIGLTYNFKRRIKDHLKTKRFKKYKKNKLIIKQLTDYINRTKAAKLEINLMQQHIDKGFILLNSKGGGGLGASHIWTKEMVIESAKKYSAKQEWRESKDYLAYIAAINNGWYKEATAHMPEYNQPPPYKWTKDKVLESAKKEKHRARWKENEPAAYGAAVKKRWLKEATAHMKLLSQKGKWSKKAVLTNAKKYKWKSDWFKNSQSAYGAAKRNGWFREATYHMLKKF